MRSENGWGTEWWRAGLCLSPQTAGGVGEGRGDSGAGRGRLSGEPKRFQGSGADDGPGVRLLEDEHFCVLEGGDERDWH